MRTPNSECVICEKPLYRRPFELSATRYVACMEHRAEAQRMAGLTAGQQKALALGRRSGTNHLNGVPKSAESKRKRAASMRQWCADNPDKVAARGAKTRGEAHYQWKGGASKLNLSIRQMTENRRWMDAVKERDGRCVRCQSVADLESHHVKPLSQIIDEFGITSRADARLYASEVWDIDNGITLCMRCHYGEHGRAHCAD